jgi:hypothetical protein
VTPFEWMLLAHEGASFFFFSPTLSDQLAFCNTAFTPLHKPLEKILLSPFIKKLPTGPQYDEQDDIGGVFEEGERGPCTLIKSSLTV